MPQLRKLLLKCLIEVEPEMYALIKVLTKSLKLHPIYKQAEYYQFKMDYHGLDIICKDLYIG
jgi:hypothetical protein